MKIFNEIKMSFEKISIKKDDKCTIIKKQKKI